MKIILIITTFLFLGCTDSAHLKHKEENTTSSPEQIQAHAKADFDAILAGKKPIYAIPDKDKSDFADGGTTFYVGEGYALTLMSRLTQEKGVNGYTYGPILTFTSPDKSIKPKEMSSVRFYTLEELKKLRGR